MIMHSLQRFQYLFHNEQTGRETKRLTLSWAVIDMMLCFTKPSSSMVLSPVGQCTEFLLILANFPNLDAMNAAIVDCDRIPTKLFDPSAVGWITTTRWTLFLTNSLIASMIFESVRTTIKGFCLDKLDTNLTGISPFPLIASCTKSVILFVK
jgi:hypothetical protein